MSTRAVTMITKRYPDDHLFDWTKMAWCQTEGTQDTDIVWFLIKEVPNFGLVSRFPQKMSCKSDISLLLLNTNRNKWTQWHVNIS